MMNIDKSERNIESLLKKYEIKQPGERWSKEREKKHGKPAWNMRQKIRTAQIIMGRLNIKGNDKKRVIYIIQDIDNFNNLCRICSYEAIIAAICFYVMKSNKSKINLRDYKVFKEYKLSEKSCLTIITKIANHYQKKCFLGNY